MVLFSHDPIKIKQREKDEKDFRKKFKVNLSYFCPFVFYRLALIIVDHYHEKMSDILNCSKNMKYMKIFNSLKGPSEFCTPWWWILMPVWRRLGASTWRWSMERFSMLYRRPARSIFCAVINWANVSHTPPAGNHMLLRLWLFS